MTDYRDIYLRVQAKCEEAYAEHGASLTIGQCYDIVEGLVSEAVPCPYTVELMHQHTNAQQAAMLGLKQWLTAKLSEAL